VGHNVAYDMLVIARMWPHLSENVWRAYDEGRVSDTLIRQKLIDIAKGRRRKSYSLAAVAEVHGLTKNADDPWRLRYSELEGTSVEDWPEDAKAYAIHDVEVTRAVYLTQGPAHADEARQCRAAWWLQIVGEAGIWTDPVRIRVLEQREQEAFEIDRVALFDVGLLRRKLVDNKEKRKLLQARSCDPGLTAKEQMAITLGPRVPGFFASYTAETFIPYSAEHETERRKFVEDCLICGALEARYSRDTKAAISRMEAAGIARETKKGRRSLDLEACQASGDPALLAYARYGSRQTLLRRIEDLWNGVDTPINLRFDSLVSTGRTSCIRGRTVAEGGATNGFQAQNVPRAPGMRECFRPASGEVIIAIDYSGMELCTWAQVCLWVLGESDLAEALNNGLDPHLALGAEMIGLNYHDALTRKKEPAVRNARQAAKAANFGFPGGLGSAGFRGYAASTWGLVFSAERAVEIKQHWLARWSEAEKYFDWIRAHRWVGRVDETQRTTIKHRGSDRIRGGCTYTEASNSYFQGLAADAAKAAGYALVRECELGTLAGWRVWNFVHDEVLIRGPEDDVDRALPLAQDIMERKAQLWVPNVRIRTEATVSRVWSKHAELIRGEDGRIVPSM